MTAVEPAMRWWLLLRAREQLCIFLQKGAAVMSKRLYNDVIQFFVAFDVNEYNDKDLRVK